MAGIDLILVSIGPAGILGAFEHAPAVEWVTHTAAAGAPVVGDAARGASAAHIAVLRVGTMVLRVTVGN